MEPKKCGICGRLLDQPNDRKSLDCGGDCVQCMADSGDPDALAYLQGKMFYPEHIDVEARVVEDEGRLLSE